MCNDSLALNPTHARASVAIIRIIAIASKSFSLGVRKPISPFDYGLRFPHHLFPLLYLLLLIKHPPKIPQPQSRPRPIPTARTPRRATSRIRSRLRRIQSIHTLRRRILRRSVSTPRPITTPYPIATAHPVSTSPRHLGRNDIPSRSHSLRDVCSFGRAAQAVSASRACVSAIV